MPLLQKQAMVNNSAVDTAVEPAFSFVELLGDLLDTENNLSCDQSFGTHENTMLGDNGEMSDCCASYEEDFEEEVYQIGEVMPQPQPAKPDGAGIDQVEIPLDGEGDDLARFLPFFRTLQEPSSSNKTLFSDIRTLDVRTSTSLHSNVETDIPEQDVQEAEVQLSKKLPFPDLSVNKELLLNEDTGTPERSVSERVGVQLLFEKKIPSPDAQESTAKSAAGKTVMVEQEGIRNHLLSAEPVHMQQESEGVLTTGQAAENTRFIQINNHIGDLKTDVLPKETVETIANQIIAKANLFVGKDQADLKLKLKPEFLGHLNLNIRVVKGVVQAHFIADNAVAASLIEGHLYDLRQSLEQQGISWQELSVSVGGEQTSQNLMDSRESYGDTPQMATQENPSRGEEQQTQGVTGWQPGSINYLI